MTSRQRGADLAIRSPALAEARKLLFLAVPIIASQFGAGLLWVVDMAMVGSVGVDALGAAALGRLWILGTIVPGMGLLFGIDAVITQAHGAGDQERLGRGLQRGLVMALLTSIPVGLLWLLTERFLVRTGQDPALARQAHNYVLVQIPALPFFYGFTVLRQYLVGRGTVLPPMWITLLANVVNAFGNWVLIHGHFGLPALGLVGTGISTSFAQFFLLSALALWVWRGRLHAQGWVPWSRAALELAGLRQVLALGLPVAVYLAFELWAFQISTLMAGWLGKPPLVSHTLILSLTGMFYMIPLGLASGATTRVGNLIGAGRPQEAQRAAWVAFALSGVITTALMAVFVAGRTWLPRFFTEDPAVLLLSATVLPIVAVFQVFDAIQVVGSGILRGMGRTVPAALFNLLGYYALALPLSWLLAGRAQWGLAGIWTGLCLGVLVIATLFLFWIWRQGPGRVDARLRS